MPLTMTLAIGLGCACQALGGFLCGVPVDRARAVRQWSGADQVGFEVRGPHILAAQSRLIDGKIEATVDLKGGLRLDHVL